MSPETFEEKPIIFGDFIKMGASQEDKMYEDLDMKKLKHVLNEVCTYVLTLCRGFSTFKVLLYLMHANFHRA